MAGPSQSVGNRGQTELLMVQLARGQIAGHRGVIRQGLNPDIDSGAGLVSIWDFGGLYAFPPSASIMTISSNNAADTAAGTGARTVRVGGLDANYTEISEVVTLNGTTPVNTVNQFLRCFGMTVLTAGNGGEAAGNIYQGTGAVVAGVPAVVYAYVRQGWGSSQMAAWTVPANNTAYLVETTTSAIASALNQSTILSIRARPFGGVFARAGSLVINGGMASLESVIPRAFAERTDIDAVAQTTDTNVVATGLLRFLVVQNNLGD